MEQKDLLKLLIEIERLALDYTGKENRHISEILDVVFNAIEEERK